MLKVSIPICLLIVVACALPLPLRKTPAQAQGTITLDPNTSYQTMTGWEAVAQVGQVSEVNVVTGKSNVNPAFAKYKDSLFDQAVSDLGINRLRLELRSGLENPVDYFGQYLNGQINFTSFKQHRYDIINDDGDPQTINPAGFQFSELDFTIDNIVLPVRHRLAARGEKLYVNLTYVDFGGSAFEHKSFPEEYAEFIYAAFAHIRDKYGWSPDGLEISLEPDNSAQWSATHVGNAIVSAGKRLQAGGFNPEISAPSTTSMANAVPYFDQFIQIPGVAQFLTEFTYHRYDGVSEQNLQAIASRARQYKLKTGQLELIGATYNDLQDDLTVGLNSSWEQFALAFPLEGNDDGSAYYLIDSNPDNPGLSLGSRAKFLRHYFKYVRAGALRIGANSTTGSFDPAAFVNTDGSFVVVVRAFSGGTLAVQGLPAGTYGIKYTTASQSDVSVADVTVSANQPLNTSLPDAGVITVYAKSAPSTVSVDAASYARSAAPGQIVAAFGVGFPADVKTSALASATPLPTKLGNVSVRVNGTLAPLFFAGVGGAQGAGAFQINYQLPYQVQPGLARVEVLNNDAPVAGGYLIVNQSVPGVFTMAANGKGQAVAINQDFTLNGDAVQTPAAKPESRGRVITLFADGPGGQFVNPANGQALTPVSGAATPASPIHATAATPVVTIGGVPATVAFSGLTPGLVGLWQLNVVIPPNAPTGGAVPVAIKINRQDSNLTTIAVN